MFYRYAFCVVRLPGFGLSVASFQSRKFEYVLDFIWLLVVFSVVFSVFYSGIIVLERNLF